MNIPVILLVRWLSGDETILFDPADMPLNGETFQTTELRDGYSESIEYLARVRAISNVGEDYSLRLEYMEEDNPHLQSLNDGWGISTLSFNVSKGTASAKWANNPPRSDYDGIATARLLSESESSEEYVSVLRRKRRQDKFKSELLKIDKVCALTGETEPSALDAAHILEVKDNGGYSPTNGVLLRSDIHRLFDRRLLTICPNGSIRLSDKIHRDSKYRAQAQGWQLKSKTLERIQSALFQRAEGAG